MIQEYYEFSPKIDELNEVGNAYDAIQSGDSRPKSPMRFSKLYPVAIIGFLPAAFGDIDTDLFTASYIGGL